jgi:hypothetical protein
VGQLVFGMDHTIERSNERGKFTEADLRTKVRESRAFWNSPAGKARQSQLDRHAEKLRRENRGVRFPALAARAGTRPELEYWKRRFSALEKSAPKI